MPNISITDANSVDIHQIAELIRQNSITRECTPEELSGEGFFVRLKTEDELIEYTKQRKKKLMVARVDEKIAAAILAREGHFWYNEVFKSEDCTGLSLDQKAMEILRADSIEYEYIVKDRTIPFNARNLTDSFLLNSIAAGYQFAFGKIYTAPIANRVSMRYHTRFGFAKMGEQRFQFKDLPGFENLEFKADLMYLDLNEYARKAKSS